MFGKHFVLLITTARRSSKRAAVVRSSMKIGTQDWPIEITFAGVTVAATDAGARELIAGLERALEKRS